MENVLGGVVGEIIEEWVIDAPIPDANPGLFASDDSEVSSEDDEPNRLGRNCIENYVENIIYLYTDIEFESHMRLTRQSAYDLDRFRQSEFLDNNEPFDPAITHERAFLLTLWYLSNTETLRQIADRFDLARSSAHRVLFCTLNYIVSLTNEYIKWPENGDEKQEISRGFARSRNIDGVIGAIDGCHVRIRKPVEHQDDDLNRKRYHSVVLQGIVTSQKIFTDVYIGEPGSMHDARILRRSPIYEKATEDPQFFGGYFLIGDSAYPSLPWLVPPFRDNGLLGEQQRLFNFRHSSTRIKVEHAFGLLRSRFRRLIRFDNLGSDLIINCILAACILNNVCILQNGNNDANLDSSSNNEKDEYNYQIVHVEDRRAYIFNQMFQ